MYARIIAPPRKSLFLFGPRGTGKSTWVRQRFPAAVRVDLLDAELYRTLLAAPERLTQLIPPGHDDWVIIDEVQKAPGLLDEVHRQIEAHQRRFVLTASSARKLRARGVNLLAGRALTCHMHPLTAAELGSDFRLERVLRDGCLPAVFSEADPSACLSAYVATCLKEEVQQEGLTRNLGAFARFLEAASFSQATVLNISQVARDCAVERKVVEGYVAILEDLLLARRLAPFNKGARRKLVSHPKLYFFDAGVYRAIRPRGPLDRPEEIDGTALETLVYQQLAAVNEQRGLGYQLSYWRTREGLEVDFVLYGERGLRAIEVKRARQLRPSDSAGLRAFCDEYPIARAVLLYGGSRRYHDGPIEVRPIESYLSELAQHLGA